MADLRRRGVLLAAAALVLAACAGSTPGADSPDDGASHSTAAAPSPAPGDPVPDLAVEAFDGSTVRLADYSGKPLVVNFWASWCPPCVAEMPDLEAVHQLADGQVTFVGVNTQDTPEAAAVLVEDTGVTYDLVRDPDGELFQDFAVFGMPSTFYVDAAGTIVGRHTGLLTRQALIDDLAAELGVTIEAAE